MGLGWELFFAALLPFLVLVFPLFCFFFFLHFRHETCFENLLAYTRTYYARFVAALYLLCSFIAVAWGWFGGERGRGRPSLGKGFVKLPFSLASDHLERELFLRIAYLSGYKEVGR